MKVPFSEKIGYALGDGAANLVFQLMMMFQLMFYTDVLGIGAGAAGLILLGARVFDAFVDPLAGILSDRFGKKATYLTCLGHSRRALHHGLRGAVLLSDFQTHREGDATGA